ncbi:MAG: hypothetical protein LQ339_000630 [Xanthoria mediterranea]|nr:MAG: hypothetical protein LQ339_000630 [Xanthoria mediterranea]
MDKLKGMASKMGGGGSGEQKPAAGGEQQDYVDKGLAAGEKKFGINAPSGANEKITDQGREMFEKQTG